MAIELTKANFDTEVASAELVVVDFWASWCGPCRAQAPILERFEGEMGKTVKVCKVNVDEQPSLAERFNIMSIPTLILFKNGSPFKKASGLQSIDGIKRLIG